MQDQNENTAPNTSTHVSPHPHTPFAPSYRAYTENTALANVQVLKSLASRNAIECLRYCTTDGSETLNSNCVLYMADHFNNGPKSPRARDICYGWAASGNGREFHGRLHVLKGTVKRYIEKKGIGAHWYHLKTN